MDKPSSPRPKPDRLTIVLRWVLGGVALGVAAVAAWYGYCYTVSPAAIRHPAQAHYHFRLQILNNGQPVDFANTKYQTDFNKDNCSALLTAEPFHFHDGLNQFVHVHWTGVTGGLLLKHYGWNFIGGPDNTLGYKFDRLPSLAAVPAHGRVLANPPAGAKYYIYTGSAESYQERSWKDFLKSDLEDFFATTTASASWLDRLVPVALAHEGIDHTAAPITTGAASATSPDEGALARLNNVLGSVIIFAQKDRPTPNQIQDRFNHLVPLPQSSCSG